VGVCAGKFLPIYTYEDAKTTRVCESRCENFAPQSESRCEKL